MTPGGSRRFFPGGGSRWGEGLGLLGLGGLVLLFLDFSWRKWPDPIVDFGRELYIPWRLAQGAVLYRDVDDYYGPLSQYLNAALFRCFGPGLMVLVTANLIIFAAILAVLYLLFRRAWGVGAALAATALFVSVFAFSQYNWCGNFNYAAPYSHETTHGFLICLLLIVVLARWIESGRWRESFAAGLLFGLTLVLKPEAMLAAGALLAVALVLKFRSEARPNWSTLATMAGGTALPTLAFTLYFACFLSFGDALNAACRGWLNGIDHRYSATPVQLTYFGWDYPGIHLQQEALGTLWAVLLLAAIVGAGWLAEREENRWLARGCSALLLLALFGVTENEINWIEAGRCLPGLVLLYLAVLIFWRDRSKPMGQAQVVRLLIAVGAAALLARMLLNARLYHYGYYQAVLAAMLVPAVMIGEIGPRLGFGRMGRVVLVVGTLTLLLPGVVKLGAQSCQWLAVKQVPVGKGRDRFYAPLSPVSPTRGDLVNEVTRTLKLTGRGQTLVVLPEGTMINYLARMPSSVPPIYYFGSTTMNGHEDEVVEQLKQHPPDWIVLVSRDLREFGVNRYGDQQDEGLQILEWVAQNYESSAAFGGDPLDVDQRGAVVLKRKPSGP